MKDYQLYLENIINALSRAGISFPADFSSYESLWESSYSLGIFLDINARLQKIGSGIVLMGLDESVTFKSYWNSEFYLEYKELKTIESNFAPENVSIKSSDEITKNTGLDVLENSREGCELESTSFGGLRSGLVGLSKSVESSSPDSSEVYHGLDDSSSGGLDTYGVSLEDFDDEEDFNEEEDILDVTKQASSEDVTDTEPVYHELEGVASSGFDSYGVDLEDYDDEVSDEDVSTEENSSSEEVYHSLESSSSSGLDYYGVALEDYEEEEENNDDSSGIIGFEEDKKVSSAESEEAEVYRSIESVSSSGLDYYGVELDYDDSEDEELEEISEDWEEPDEVVSSEAGFDLEEVVDYSEDEADFSEAGFDLDDLDEEEEPEEVSGYDSEEAEDYSDAGFDLDGLDEEEEVDFSEAGFDLDEEEPEDEPEEPYHGVSNYSEAGFDLDSLDEEELADSSEAGFSLEDDEPEEPHIVSDRSSPEVRSESPYLGEGSIRREPVRKPTHYPKEVESTTNILNFLGSMEKKFRKKRGK